MLTASPSEFRSFETLEWECPNPACGTVWNGTGRPAEWLCQQLGCDAIGCDDCRLNCSSCLAYFCGPHLYAVDGELLCALCRWETCADRMIAYRHFAAAYAREFARAHA
jgi:hypothetical protein